jgi:methionyl-tRNA synthetase
MANKFYITTPIYYVNASPHIGHSYTNIAADTLARYMRQALGKENVWFLTGTDEHGQKIQKAADEAKMTPQEFVDRVVVQFRGLWSELNISYDDFIRTTEKRHIDFVQRSLEIVHKNGDIYEDKYEGWYCTPCETFWVESEVGNKLCPACQRPVEHIAEKNFFFQLSKYQDWLIGHIKSNPGFIKPASRQEEVLRFLELNKLNDLCISRPKERLNWGIPLPFSASHVTYVWFDALINYISAVGSFDEKGSYKSDWWNEHTYVVNLIGKDILRHHAVYWPIMLKSLGIKPPDTIFAHGWWMINQDKMSKSRGNVINPLDMVRKYGVDTYRYFLLRDVPFGLDGNFSEEAIIKRYNSDLANDLGNLVYRTLTMIEKYFAGEIPELKPMDSQGRAVKEYADDLSRLCALNLSRDADYNFGQALEHIWELVNMANKYVEETKPWNLAKEKKGAELKAFLCVLVTAIRKASFCAAPFIPRTAEAINAQFEGKKINKGQPLFPRIETRPA